jgi:hypothetical protein
MLIPAVVFLFSGVAALLYQVIWQRLLVLFACAELAIAAFGALSETIYYDQLYQRIGPADLQP